MIDSLWYSNTFNASPIELSRSKHSLSIYMYSTKKKSPVRQRDKPGTYTVFVMQPI